MLSALPVLATTVEVGAARVVCAECAFANVPWRDVASASVALADAEALSTDTRNARDARTAVV